MFNNLQVKLDSKDNAIDNEEVVKLRRELDTYKRRSEIMSGVISHLGESLSNVERKIDVMEFRNMKRHVVISGLGTDNKIFQCMKQVRSFLVNTLRVQIEIIDCFKLGQGQFKLVVIQVESITDRARIFKAMEVYRKQCEDREAEQNIFINDYIPAEMKENKRKQKDIFRNNEKEGNNKAEMSIDKRNTQSGWERL